MSSPAVIFSKDGAVRELRLAELPRVATELAALVKNSGYQPEVIVYVETGARLLAYELAGLWGIPPVPVWVRRGGHGLKRILSPVARRLPVAVRDAMRRLEERTGVQRLTVRSAALPNPARVAGRRVLLVDDAADTGRTIKAARGLLMRAGVRETDIRTAVIAATMAGGRAAVDFYLLDRNHRMPWSADSAEHEEAELRAINLLSHDAIGDL